jgi:hypothetical protein
MAFPSRPRRAPAPVPTIRVPVFAVGQQVYVACAGDRSARATLTDDAGKKPLASLGDGAQVAILGWRPGVAGTARYRVRATDSGLDGWLPVGNLRLTEAAIAPAPTASPLPAVDPAPLRVGGVAGSGRRFGQRFE